MTRLPARALGRSRRLICIMALFTGTWVLLVGLSPAPTSTPALPAFTAIREHTNSAGTWRYQFDYTDDRNWTLTQLSSPDPNGVTGQGVIQQVSSGRSTVIVLGEIIATGRVAANAREIPGPWFISARGFAHYPQGPGSPLSRATQNGGRHSVYSLTNGDERTSYIYHAETGIPVGFERVVDGRVVELHRTTSLVLASGKRLQ